MKFQTVRISCILLISCSHGYGAADSIAENQEMIVAEYDKVNAACQRYSERKLDTPDERNCAEEEFSNVVVRADSKIKKAIVNLLEEGPDFEILLAKTNKIISWREFPKDNSHAKRMDFKYGAGLNDKKLRINYMSWAGKDNETFYLMQNSFWNTRTRGIRIVPSTYVLSINNEKVSISDLIENLYFSLNGAEVPYPIAPVKWEDGQTDVLVLHGPSGSGSFSHYLLYSYNAQLDQWETAEEIANTEQSIGYSYKEDTGELHYERLWALNSDNSLERTVQEVVFKMCGSKSPLKLAISPIKDIKYHSEHAPVKLIFRNVGPELIEIGNSDITAGKGYVGNFFIRLKKKDGTSVFNLPGVAVQKGLVAETFRLDPDEEVSFMLDIAKLYNVNRLKTGEYTLCITFLTKNPSTSNYFSGMLKSNLIDLMIRNK